MFVINVGTKFLYLCTFDRFVPSRKKSFRPRCKGRKRNLPWYHLYSSAHRCTNLIEYVNILIILRQYNGCNRRSLLPKGSACSSGMYSGICFMHLSSPGNFLYKPKNPYWFPSSLFSLVLMIALLKKKIKQILYIFYKTLEDEQFF